MHSSDYFSEKEFIPMSVWIVRIILMKLHHLPYQHFYSKLNDKGIIEEDYSHPQTVWCEFNIRNMREYHDLYPLSDTLLLANVLTNIDQYVWITTISTQFIYPQLQGLVGKHFSSQLG